MYLELQQRLLARVREVIQTKYEIELGAIAIEQPPDVKLGEFALPVAFELARKLRKAPKIIATELAAALSENTDDPAFASFESAGAGYLNVRLNRAVAAAQLASEIKRTTPNSGLHVLVEHTSINPNKAAHVGHLRNAILGDTFVRILRANGQKVDVQNYIDNTGVQVADVVVGFLHLEGMSPANIRNLLNDFKTNGEKFDYLCWDVYARVSQWYGSGSEEENKQRKSLRYATLHEIEAGNNETAAVAELISTAVLRSHLETMLRLDITYDFLPRESEILHLKFWDLAFEQLKQTGVLYFETEGKNKGCWVMTRPETGKSAKAVEEGTPNPEVDEDAKVIVRSNGTVTYVGKDIAYHLWKFGLLGRDFGYRPFFQYPDHTCWISTEHGEADHPHFGGAQAIYNVIDSRQSDPQANVIQALRGMGHTAEADRYTHFSYEMVALTPRCAEELGYTVAEEDKARPYIEVSGRKGFGVKADDLIDKLIAATRKETDARQPDRPESERQHIAEQIAIGALRYFMLKFTRGTVIAFDFKDALSFEGETGPYVQYAIVRIRNIFRKAEIAPEAALDAFAALDPSALSLLNDADEIWAIWLRAAKRSAVLAQCIATSEPAFVARHVFQLAQEFNNFYHRHHILTEVDPTRKTLLLATAAIALRELVLVLSWLGIESPEAM